MPEKVIFFLEFKVFSEKNNSKKARVKKLKPPQFI